ncbi:MAG TPA: methyltransferase [Streptosporangiaceae bacterium]|nr:methyltransferase [Streptosporangiaceae bacterium]
MSDVDRAAIGAAVRQLLAGSLGYLNAAALRVAVRARVADSLADGPLPVERIAELGGVDPGHLRRVLRFLATREVFREDEDGNFHLTTAAGLLRADSPIPLQSLILLFTDQTYWVPAGRLDDTVRKGVTVFDEIFGAQFFDYLATDEERQTLFSDAMACMSLTETGGVVQSYDFPEKGTVVDVGGGLGGLLYAVLSANPGLQGILFDREPVLRRHRLADPALDGRWETVAGDFYAGLPADADLYLIKRILHDKSDADCVRLLRSCRRSMAADGRVLIIDPLVPADGDYSPSIKLSDVLMMAVFEGKERTADELGALLGEADLAVSRIIPTPTTLTIVEAAPR